MVHDARLDVCGKRVKAAHVLWAILATYSLFGSIFGLVLLDIDEFTFVREPYELIGGDYTMGYLKEGDVSDALSVAARSYYFYWKYRPLNSPIIDEEDRVLYAAEEARFGYTKPEKVKKGDPESYNKYSKRLVVPEPDRFYSHGAGKPLLPALLSLPQLAVVQVLFGGGNNLLHLQHTLNYHPLFIVARGVQLLFGVLSILILYKIVSKRFGVVKALWAAALFGLSPLAIKYFPNLHHDSIVVPFALLAVYGFSRSKYVLSGISFGLAMASKNIAVGLVVAFLVQVAWEWFSRRPSLGAREACGYLASSLKGLGLVFLLGLVTLIPFANPISYGIEILTPITHREYDPRGELVSEYMLGATETNARNADQKSTVRPEIDLLQSVTRFKDVCFFFACLGLLGVLQRKLSPLEQLSFLVLLLVLPYGLVFDYDLSYRGLMFAPFFTILVVAFAKKVHLRLLLFFFVVLDILYCLDPVTTDYIHYTATSETLVQVILRVFGFGT